MTDRRAVARAISQASVLAQALEVADQSEHSLVVRVTDALRSAHAWAGVLACDPRPRVALEPRSAVRGALVARATLRELRGDAELWELAWDTFQKTHEQALWFDRDGKPLDALSPFPTKLRLAAERWRIR